MAHEAHEEFPPLTKEAEKLLLHVEQALHPGVDRKDEPWGQEQRTIAATVIRQALRQVEPAEATERQWRPWLRLEAMADNLHSLPPPPSMAALRKAVRELQGWDGGMEIRTGDWIRERIGVVKRGIDHHLKG